MIEVQLANGKGVALLSPEDEELASFKWYVHYGRGSGPYAKRGIRKPGTKSGWSTKRMHRDVLERKLGRELEPSEVVDHINGNGLDNRRSNLRIATDGQNKRNAGLQANNTTGFKGVWLYRSKFVAQLQFRGKNHYIGCYDTAEDAAKAYDRVARRMFDTWARFNFPEVGEKHLDGTPRTK